MEQKIMFYLSSARNHSPKVFNFKKALQVAVVLIVAIWLLYQVKNSNFNPKNYGGKTLNKISKELESETSTLLGRKGKVGLIVNGALAYLEEVNANAKEEDGTGEDGGVGDDKFDRNIEEREVEMEVNKKHIDQGRVDDEGEENILVQTSEMEGTNEAAISQGHVVHSFHDQTGVPLDGLDHHVSSISLSA